MTRTLPTVTPRGVLAATRATFVLLAAALVPLLAQHLFGPGLDPGTAVLFAGSAAVAALALARAVVREGATAAGLFGRGVAAGLASGAVMALAYAALVRHSGSMDGYVMAPVFGAIYGVGTGALLGAVFATWGARARAALERPSAVASQRLTMEAGLALALAGAVGVGLYRVQALAWASVAMSLAGLVVIAAATARVVRMNRLLAAIARPDGGYQVVPRSPSTEAPALAWVPALDRVVVRAPDPSAVEPAPFRTNSPAAEVAVVPQDLSLVHRALGRAVAFGLGAIALAVFAHGAVAFLACASCAGAAPCSGCAH